jgi:hypothetical protein
VSVLAVQFAETPDEDRYLAMTRELEKRLRNPSQKYPMIGLALLCLWCQSSFLEDAGEVKGEMLLRSRVVAMPTLRRREFSFAEDSDLCGQISRKPGTC